MSAATIAFEERNLVIPVNFVTTLGATPAIVLAFFVNWHKTMSKKPNYAGEIYKTLQKVAEETGLSIFQVRKAKNALEKLGVLETRVDKKQKNATFWKPILEQIASIVGNQSPKKPVEEPISKMEITQQPEVIKEVAKPVVEEKHEKPEIIEKKHNVELPFIKDISPRSINKFNNLPAHKAIEVKNAYNNATGIKNPAAFITSLIEKAELDVLEDQNKPPVQPIIKPIKCERIPNTEWQPLLKGHFEENEERFFDSVKLLKKPSGDFVMSICNPNLLNFFRQYQDKLETLLSNKIVFQIG
jgi:hypothetical protein